MKNFNRIHIGVIGALVLLASCNKYLDKEPDNRTEINTVQKVAQLVGTAYPSADYLSFAESASDNAVDKGPGVGNSVDTRDRPYAWKILLVQEPIRPVIIGTAVMKQFLRLTKH